MLGLILNDDRVAWADDRGVIHRGIVVALTDDELWAEVREFGQDDIIELPTSSLQVFIEYQLGKYQRMTA